MIKKTISLLLIVGFSLGISAQKKNQKKNSRAEKAVNEAAEAVREAAADATSGYNYSDNEIDTLNYSAGKAYVFLIKADEWNSQGVGDDLEEKELRKNFDKKAFEIININKYSYITFENGQFLDVSSIGNSYEAIAFWSGKNDDDIQTQEGRAKATEFVAKQLGLKKESSYIINDKKYKKEIENLLSKNNFTPKSKEVMDYYLKQISTPLICYLGDKELVFNQNHDKVKTIKTYFVDKKDKKTIYEEIIFNENGQPFSVKHFGSEGNQKSVMKFVYANNILKQILGEESETNISYDNGQIVLSKKVGAADETTIFYFENGRILRKSYTIMQDENAASMNSFSEEKLKDDCIQYTINSEIWTKICSSKPGEFPFTHNYTSYQDGKILQEKYDKITKKSEVLYELFSQNSSNDDQNLKPLGTYHINEKGLIKTYIFAKDDETKKLEIEYTFFP